MTRQAGTSRAVTVLASYAGMKKKVVLAVTP